MPVLTRDDGAQFAVYTYRETLSTKNIAMLRREAMIISRENGQFARFFTLISGEVEAVFSRDPGYLLGELVWQHFDKPLDLIYCEALDDGENALLIVVRGGSVYLDAELPIVNLADEFLSLISGDNSYEIYVYGDVPLAEFATDEKFAFDSALVASFTELPTPVYPTIALDPAYRLLPIDEALVNFKPPTSPVTKVIIAIVLIGILGYVGWKILQPTPQIATVTPGNIITPTQQTKTTRNPYSTYQSQLATPAPSDIIMSAVADTQLLLTIPGWTPTNMTYDKGALTFDLKANGGDLGILLSWVKMNKVDLEGASGKAVIVFPLNVQPRAKPTIIYSLRDTVASLYDILKRIIPDSGPSLGATTQADNFKKTVFEISFAGVSPETLVLLARELQTYPVILDTFSLSIDSGILSGTMQLQILGA